MKLNPKPSFAAISHTASDAVCLGWALSTGGSNRSPEAGSCGWCFQVGMPDLAENHCFTALLTLQTLNTAFGIMKPDNKHTALMSASLPIIQARH